MVITAKFTDHLGDVVDITIEEENKLTEKRKISFLDFRAILETSSHVEDVVRIGALPQGYVDGSCSRSDQSTYRVFIEVPAQVRAMQYYDKNIMVPYPTLLFVLIVNSGRLIESFCYAVAEQKVSGKSLLYHYPYGNVYQTGKICWGNNFIGRIQDIKSSERVIELFFGSETNNDLWASCDEKKYPTQEVFLEEMKEQEVFPENCLARCTEYATVQEIFYKYL